jgi:hypothetical protein
MTTSPTRVHARDRYRPRTVGRTRRAAQKQTLRPSWLLANEAEFVAAVGAPAHGGEVEHDERGSDAKEFHERPIGGSRHVDESWRESDTRCHLGWPRQPRHRLAKCSGCTCVQARRYPWPRGNPRRDDCLLGRTTDRIRRSRAPRRADSSAAAAAAHSRRRAQRGRLSRG